MKIKQPNISIDRNLVVIEDTTVSRPTSMSPSQWTEFWTEVTDDYIYEENILSGEDDKVRNMRHWE